MGYNLKPLDLQGAIGSVQLLKFDEIHTIRRKNKNLIGNILSKIPGVRVVTELEQSETSWFGVPVVCDNKELKHKLVSYLEANKIQTRNYFAGNILLHPGYSHLDKASKYPKASQVLDKVFFLGCSPTITTDMIDYIDSVVGKFYA
jgi:CDP-6-deoxy-D-xylo-4-hexulose-3-dehydrase